MNWTEVLIWTGAVVGALELIIAGYRSKEQSLKEYVVLTKTQYDDRLLEWIGKAVNGLTYVLDFVGAVLQHLPTFFGRLAKRKDTTKPVHELLRDL